MSIYAYYCPYCGEQRDLEFVMGQAPKTFPCRNCLPEIGKPTHQMVRDFKAENKVSTFHPTRDVYGMDVAQRAKKEKP